MRRFFATLFALVIFVSEVAASGFLINPYVFAPAVTGISLVGTASNTGINGSNLIVSLPGGTAEGDVVYAAVAIGGLSSAGNNTVTSGYTELADNAGNDDDDITLGVYRKVMGAVPDTNVEFNGRGNAASSVCGVVMVLRGVNTSPTEDATTTTATGSNTGNADPPSITTVTANAWVLAFGAGAHDSVTSGPAGYEDLVTAAEGGDTERCALGLSRILKATAGAENPGAYTITGSLTRSWAAATVAVRPAP